ncbi:SDR family oxidoreductase [Pseudomonas asiatica]|uniref:SDR family oxidoreductase n=1 Tax=Pseudomonas asiatica TaxID=2219225 RepID=UPI0010BFB1BF|nr:SDR family oxidoreductase [Pseudomonas asiatica]
MNDQRLQGRVAVITGASSGIGEATARLLAAQGMQVVVVARRSTRIEALAAELGDNALAVTADVADIEQVARLFDQVRERFGGVDLLFNNAGVGINGTFAESAPVDWKAQIDSNLMGVLHCTHAAIPLMQGREGAMISTVSSVGGRHGVAGWAVYCATKFAVNGFHEALRKELGEQGIRVSLIQPGAVWTEWGDKVPDDAMRSYRESLDALHSEDVAQALLYSFAQPARVLVNEIVVRPVRQLLP